MFLDGDSSTKLLHVVHKEYMIGLGKRNLKGRPESLLRALRALDLVQSLSRPGFIRGSLGPGGLMAVANFHLRRNWHSRIRPYLVHEAVWITKRPIPLRPVHRRHNNWEGSIPVPQGRSFRHSGRPSVWNHSGSDPGRGLAPALEPILGCNGHSAGRSVYL